MNHLLKTLEIKLSKVFFMICLVATTNAYADFRKALDFLQKTQGIEMLVEVEDAVKTKNNDGLSLFLGTLSDRLMNDEFYNLKVTGDNFYINGKENEKILLLGKDNIPELMQLLEHATKHADVETLFDFAILKSKLNSKDNRSNMPNAELEKFASLGVKRASNMLSYRMMSDFYSKKPSDTNLKNEFEAIKNSAKQGNSDSVVRLVIVYLRWLPYEQHPDKVFFNVIPPNESEGIYWLKRYASNAYHGDYLGPCKLADEYYDGVNLNKDNKQAYLWYMQSAFITGSWQDECTTNGLRNMAYSGDLEQLNPKLTELIKNEEMEPLRTYINSLSGKLESPRDLVLLKTPPNKEILYSVKENRYSLEVYKNGKVKFEGYSSYLPPEVRVKLNSYIVGRDEWVISDKKLKEFTQQLNALDASLAPTYITESVLCDTGEHWRTGQININTGKTNKTIGYSTIRHTFYTPILAKIFKVQEINVPTQHLRCGAARIDKNYKNCVGEDAWNINHADEVQYAK